MKNKDLKSFLGHASDKAVDWIESMLKYNPKSRPTIVEILDHPFFNDQPDKIFASPKIFDEDAFDSLKIGKDGIKISKNQKFSDMYHDKLRPTHNLSFMTNNIDENYQQNINKYQKVKDAIDQQLDDIKRDLFIDSALLQNERSKLQENKHSPQTKLKLLNK